VELARYRGGGLGGGGWGGGGMPVTGGLCAGWHTVVHSMGSSNRCCGEESMLVHKGVPKGNIYEP
jgi:hypothetical protein